MWYFAWILGTAFAVFFAVVVGLAIDIREDQKHQSCAKKCHNH